MRDEFLPEVERCEASFRRSKLPSEFRRWEDFNHLASYSRLENRYFAMRHGFSSSNSRRLTASDPDIARSSFGLMDEGRSQVRGKIRACRALGLFDSDTRIVSSDFLRAVESADIAGEELQSRPLARVEWLRERYFGALDMLDHEYFFPFLHPYDVEDPFTSRCGCEPPVLVMDRLSRGIVSLEASFSGQTILLLTHHDAMQILECVFRKRYPGRYAGTPDSPYPQIENAEVRPLFLGS